MTQSTVSVRTYIYTVLALLAFTLLTSLLGLIDPGRFSFVAGVAIAAVKAL